jgi:cysteine sulfinate desulfinase/cysteine desulfurase-like protein
MLPYLTSYYGNPHSRTHAYGWESEKAMETARKQVSGRLPAVRYFKAIIWIFHTDFISMVKFLMPIISDLQNPVNVLR